MVPGRSYDQVGRWNSHRVYFLYVNFSSQVLCTSSSKICSKLVLANISIQGWIIDTNVDSFFDGSNWVLVLSPHYDEVIYANHMTRDDILVS